MAFGFNSRQSIDIPLKDLNPEQFIMLAVDTAIKLGWGIYFFNSSGLMAKTSEDPFVLRDSVVLHINNGIAHVKSRPTGVKMPDPSLQTRPEFPARGDKRKGATIHDFAARLEEARRIYTPEQLTGLYEKNLEHMSSPDQNVQSLASSSQGKWQGLAGFFIPRKNYFITPIIIDLNVLVFLLMVLSGISIIEPDVESVIQWGANYKPLTLDGQWWRLLTCCFVHFGIIHILMNMYAFLYIGLLLEPLLGRWKFTIAYLLTGIAASTTSLYWHWNDAAVSAGASGAIFGMYGVFLAMLTTNLIHPEKRKPLLRSIGFFVLFNLGFGTLGTIDNSAHIGGLVCGLLIGYLLYPVLKQKTTTGRLPEGHN